MYGVQPSSFLCCYTPNGNVTKAIPGVLGIISTLGIVIAGLGIAGHFPFYAALIGFSATSTACIAGAFVYLCRPQSKNPLSMGAAEERIPSQREARSLEEIYYDTLAMHIFPRLTADELGNAAQVCKFWQAAAYEELHWKEHWKLEHGNEPLPPEFHTYREAFQHFRSVQSRYIRGVLTQTPLCSKASAIRLSGDVLCTGHQSSFGFLNLRFWNLATRSEINAYKGVSSFPLALAGRGERLFLAFDDGKVLCRNLQDGKIDFPWTFPNACTFMFVEGDRLICGTPQQLQMIDADSYKSCFQLRFLHSVVDVKKCGDMLACAFKNGIVEWFSFADGTPISRQVFNGGLTMLYIHQDRIAITGHENGSMDFWDIESEKQLLRLESPFFEPVQAIQYFGKTLLSRQGEQLCIWNTETRTCQRTFALDSTLEFNASHMAMLSKETVKILDFSIT